ncbi:MAG: serine hydrolase [Oscillospiraceae bacterium]|nr:serine hydrolase [Oscillospiraceae bacterium]
MALDMIASIKFLQYLHKLLDGERETILRYPYTPQKPRPHISGLGERLERCSLREAGVSAVQLEGFFKKLCGRYGVGAHNILLCRHGKVFCKAGWAPYSPDVWHVTHSLCKSVTGTAIGLLIGEGRLTLNDKAGDLLDGKMPFLASTNIRSVTVRDLLMMSSGVQFKETGSILEPLWSKAFFRAPQEFEPGTRFDYNSMNSYLLACIVQKVTGMGLMDYLNVHLFQPMGIRDAAWEKSPENIEKGGWGMYLLPEDVAKLGLLYLQKGKWHGKQLLPQVWTEEATTTQITGQDNDRLIEYGYHIWTRQSDGMFQFNGMFGQYMVAYPKWDMIAVMNSGNAHLDTHAFALDCMDEFFAGGKIFQRENAMRETAAAHRLGRTLQHLKFEEPYAFRTGPADKELALFAQGLLHKTYVFSKNTTGLLPLVLQCMNGNFSRGLQELTLHDGWLEWKESDETYRLPFAAGEIKKCTLSFHGEEYLTAVTTEFLRDENRELYLKLRLCLLETSSSRWIKIYQKPDGLWMICGEEPGFAAIVNMVLPPQNSQEAYAEAKDMGYAKYKLRQLFQPTLYGKEKT